MPTDYTFAVPRLMEMQTPRSDLQPTYLEFEPHTLANTNWIGVSEIGPFTLNGDPMPFAAARVVLEFFEKFGCEKVLWSFDSDAGGDGTAVIESPSAWLFSIPEQPVGLPPGMWPWRLRVTDVSGVTRQLHTGTMIVEP